MLDRLRALLRALSPTQRKLLAGLAFSAVALVATFIVGGDDADHQEIVERLCRAPGLETLAKVGEVALCTHGPDPARAFTAPRGDDPTPVRPKRLCRTTEGAHRVVAFAEAPVTAEKRRVVWRQLGLINRHLKRAGDPVTKPRYACGPKGRPKVKGITIPWTGPDAFTSMWNAMYAQGHTRAARIYLVFAKPSPYPYCGQGTVGGARPGPHYSLIACWDEYGYTATHELGHNLGAVALDAPHSSGAWHCFKKGDIMCYADGGPYFANGGRMVACNPRPVEVWDCKNEDYHRHSGAHWDTADSPFLSIPRREGGSA